MDIKNYRYASVMPDGTSIANANAGIAMVQQRANAGGASQRFPDYASYLRYQQGRVQVQRKNNAKISSGGGPTPPPTVPGVPTNISIAGSNSALTVSFTAPSNGGSPITDYEYSLDGGSFTSAGVTSSPFTITGLTNGQTYSVVIRAVNAIGVGNSSPPVSGTPVNVPDSPTINSVESGDGQLTVNFTPPAFDSGSPITTYYYTTDGGTFVNNANTTTSPYTITGLTNGTEYQVGIYAQNVIGRGPVSNIVNATPNPVITTLAITSLVNNNPAEGTITINIATPTANQNLITQYRLNIQIDGQTTPPDATYPSAGSALPSITYPTSFYNTTYYFILYVDYSSSPTIQADQTSIFIPFNT